jgi:hypothetical protein
MMNGAVHPLARMAGGFDSVFLQELHAKVRWDRVEATAMHDPGT